jgi:S-formylglutathione hydrolase FrmB
MSIQSENQEMKRLFRLRQRTRSYVFTYAIALLSVITFVPSLHAQGRAECSAINSQMLGRPVRYCAFLPPGFEQDKVRRYPVLYYLHGLGDDEQSLLNSGGWDLISEMRAKGKIGDFIILAPSAGVTFYINSENGKVPYEDFFMKEFMPQMEKKYRAQSTRATRGIMGISMGGYGALRYAFKYPNDFAAVSAEMPALIPELPKNISTGDGGLGQLLSGIFGSPVNRAYFDRNNVFYFAQTDSVESLKRLKIYFVVGSNDDYGFEQGAEKLNQLLNQRSIPHEFHLYSGGHTLEFVLQHFPEAIQLQWSAIGTGK